MKLIVLLLILASTAALSDDCANKEGVKPPLCSDESSHGERVALGLTFQTLLPNQLQDFDTNVFGYGPFGLIPLGPGAIQIQGLYGFNAGISLYLVETGYRFTVSTPFFTGFAMTGAHYLHYGLQGRDHSNLGINLGLGLFQGISKNFGANLFMKAYIQERSILSFGGGFTLLL